MPNNSNYPWNILDGYRGIPQPPVAPADPRSFMGNYSSVFPQNITGDKLLAVPLRAGPTMNFNPGQNSQPSGGPLNSPTGLGAAVPMTAAASFSQGPLADRTSPIQTAQAAPANAPATVDSPPLPGGVDWDFIKQREGNRTNGYVPPQKDGTPSPDSGVTIAHGFDMGGRTPDSLRQLGLPDELVSTLSPYVGLHGQAAQDYVTVHPLNIKQDQVDAIDGLVFPSPYKSVSDQYNAAANGTRFQDLPQGAQTAIVDLAHQYGNLAKRTPLFWNQVTGGQWQQAQDDLMNFHDAYGSRRELEAGKMQEAIKSGRLSNPPGSPAPGS